MDFHGWRQTLTAMVARNFLRDGMNLFAPRLDDLQPYFEFEFQVYPFLVALLYQAFGVREWLGRLTSVAFGLGALAYLYALGRRYVDRTGALAAAGLFAVLPMAVYYTRTFMPEAAMLFFSVLGIFHFGRWIDGDRDRDFGLAALGICGALLVKVTTLYLLFPLAYLAWTKYGRGMFGRGRLWGFLLLVLAPPVLWYGYTGALALAAPGGANIWLQNDKLLGVEYLLRPKFYRLIFLTRLGEKMLAFSAFPLFLAGAWLVARRPGRAGARVLLVWTGAVFLFFFAVAKGNYIHEYYQLPVIPPACLLAGRAVSAAVRRAREGGRALRRDAWVRAVAVLLLFVPVHAFWKVADRLETKDSLLRFARQVAAATEPEDRLLVQDGHQTDLLYYADRRGWYVGGHVPLGPDEVEAYRGRGARFYVNRYADLKDMNPALYRHLKEGYPFLREDGGGIIVDLRRSRRAGGAEAP